MILAELLIKDVIATIGLTSVLFLVLLLLERIYVIEAKRGFQKVIHKMKG